ECQSLLAEQLTGQRHQFGPRPARRFEALRPGSSLDKLSVSLCHADAEHVGLHQRRFFGFPGHADIVATKIPARQLLTYHCSHKDTTMIPAICCRSQPVDTRREK